MEVTLLTTHLILLQPPPEMTEQEVRGVLSFLEAVDNDLLERFAFTLMPNSRYEQDGGFSHALVIRASHTVLEKILAHPEYQNLMAYVHKHYSNFVIFEGDVDMLWPRKKRIKEKIAPEEWQKKSVEQRLKILLMEELDVKEHDLVPAASFVEDLNADSLDLVEIIMGIEEEFGVEIGDKDFGRITTVGEALDLLAEHGIK